MKPALRSPRLLVPVFLAAASLFLVPWSGWLARSLPCRYLSVHWAVAWSGFDAAIAVTLALTVVGVVRRARWVDRAAISAATLLAADAWFDVVTSHGAVAVTIATAEAVAVELPIALLCIWVAQRLAHPAAHDQLVHPHQEGVLS
jgi:hypothetical protein